MAVNRKQAATLGLLIPAALALGMSADTSYRFLETALQITDDKERMILCGVAEAAIVALTLYAWATRTKGPAYLAYAAVLVQAVPAFTVSGTEGGIVRVVLGPVLLAVLLHLMLGLELRMAGEKKNGLIGAALKEARERLTAYLGIGRRGEDSASIARSRAADRAVDLVDRIAGSRKGSRARARYSARLAAAIDAARHGLPPEAADEAEAAIVARVVRRKSASSLAEIGVQHDWTAALARTSRREIAEREPGRERGESTGREAREIPQREVREIQGEVIGREVSDDLSTYAASLLAHEPPAWEGLSLREAVTRADRLIPGMSATDLSEVLGQVGVKALNGEKPSPGSIRSTRSALRKAIGASQT